MKDNIQTLKHKGYIGSIEVSVEDEYMHGKVLFIQDRIIYGGNNVKELKQSFIEAVDDYLEFCKEIDKKPNTTCSGSFNVRISPELHYETVRQAYHKGMSLNAYVALAIETQTKQDSKRQEISQKLNTLNDRLLRVTAKINYEFSAKSIQVEYDSTSHYAVKPVIYESYGSMC